jgi:hypothetical protein
MRRDRLAFTLGGVVVLLALSAGCASVAPTTSASGAPGLPDWVLVVPPPDSERAFYVGGCAAAPDTASGISEAMTDARTQARGVAREKIVPLVDASFREAGVETEAIERAQFRALVVEPMVDRLAGTLRRERVFYRECAAPEAAADPTARLCDLFVLMTADLVTWERLPVEVMADLRKRKQSEAGDLKSVQLLDWILRRYVETEPGDEDGGRGSEQP